MACLGPACHRQVQVSLTWKRFETVLVVPLGLLSVSRGEVAHLV